MSLDSQLNSHYFFIAVKKTKISLLMLLISSLATDENVTNELKHPFRQHAELPCR